MDFIDSEYTLNQGNSPQFVYANFAGRLVASLVDGLLIAIPTVIMDLFINIQLSFLIYPIYRIVFDVLYKGTVGKMVMQIQVLAENGARISWSQSLKRNILYLASSVIALFFHVGGSPDMGDSATLIASLVIIVACFYMFVDKQRRTYYDLMAETVVVQRPASNFSTEGLLK